jgi:hypothetical protein
MTEEDREVNGDGGGNDGAGTAEPQAKAPADGGDMEASERRWLLARLATPPGLCAACAHLRLLASPRSVFVRCGMAATDPAFPRYPALPVTRCAGYTGTSADRSGSL